MVTATEINIAYRTSDFDRWQQMDFVVGIEIEPSPTNHKDYDLCYTLAGKYPKGFKFTGWHPHCRCIATPILKTKQEMQRDTERIMQGKEPEQRSENTVHGVPKKYEQWVEDNQQRIRRNTMPYFLKDNGEVNSKGEYRIKAFAYTNNAPTYTTIKKPLSDDAKLRRKQIMQQAKQWLPMQTMRCHEFPKDLKISVRGIKEWLNQPFENIEAKNELLLQLPNTLKEAHYIGNGADKHDPTYTMHLFRITTVMQKQAWIIVRENGKGECFVHSITDSESITHYITKERQG